MPIPYVNAPKENVPMTTTNSTKSETKPKAKSMNDGITETKRITDEEWKSQAHETLEEKIKEKLCKLCGGKDYEFDCTNCADINIYSAGILKAIHDAGWKSPEEVRQFTEETFDAYQKSVKAGRKLGRRGIEYYTQLPYLILLHQVEDEGKKFWVAEVPELPGCKSHGSTVEEAVESVEEAKKDWILDSLEKGEDVPVPIEGRQTGDFLKSPIAELRRTGE